MNRRCILGKLFILGLKLDVEFGVQSRIDFLELIAAGIYLSNEDLCSDLK
jgi:hypothetical protein